MRTERKSLAGALGALAGESAELTMTIAGEQRMAQGARIRVVAPHDHQHVLGETAQACAEDMDSAIEAALVGAENLCHLGRCPEGARVGFIPVSGGWKAGQGVG
jgi:delta 1-pyrroline-5-carboxylate dehydrogenase